MLEPQNNKNISVDYQFDITQRLEGKTFKELKVCDQNIAFFDEVLSKSFKFYEVNKEEWLLIFFKGSEYQKIIQVKIANQKQAYAPKSIGAAYFFQGKSITDEVVDYAKDMLGSKSLTKNSFTQTSSTGFVTTVRRGFVYVTETPGQFERAVILNGLAHAYRLVMNELSNLARDAVAKQNSKVLMESAEKGFYFNVGFYSRYPIKLENEEIRKFWESFEDQWQISKINEELERQLVSMHSLLQFKESVHIANKHQNQNIKLTFMITIAGLAFSLLSTLIAHSLGWNS